LPGAGIGLRQGLLALLFLARFDFLCGRRQLLSLGLGDGGVLQFDLIAQIVECGLSGSDAGLRLGDLRLVIGGINLHQQIAGLDVLVIGHGNGENLAGDPAAQPRQVGPNIGIVGGLNDGASDPGIPSQGRQRDKGESNQHRGKWNRNTHQ
jgi:hypothetical protein